MKMERIRTSVWWAVVLAACSGAIIGARQQPAPAPEVLMGRALHQQDVEGDLQGAIATYRKVVADPRASRDLVARALLRVGLAQEGLGRPEARSAYERVVRDYADQTEIVGQARNRLTALTSSDTLDTRVVAQQVWAGDDDVDPWGAPSSDARQFVFVRWSFTTGGSNIAVRDLVSGQTRELTHSTTAEYGMSPVISPDGSEVAYVWMDSSIRITSIDGMRTRVLVEKPGFFIHNLRWSPTGRQLAVIAIDYPKDRTGQILLISTTDGRITQLKSLGWKGAELGGFSPDGRFLVYALEGTPPDHDIFAIAVDGSREDRLVQGPGKDTSPAWAPDGRRVVFVSDRSGTQDLWSVRIGDGKAQGDAELLRSNVGDITPMGFVRDGTYFYGTINQKRDVYITEFEPDSLHVTSAKRLSDRYVGANAGGAWSPDGGSIAFMRGTDRRTMSLVIRTLSDGTERTLPTKLADSSHAQYKGPVWMPDGRALLVPDIDYSQDMAMIRLVDADTGADRVLVQGADVWPVPCVAPDGQTLYYTKVEKTGKPDLSLLRLVARELSSGREAELYRVESSGVGFFALAVSPDGRQIAFTANEGTEPGKERALVAVPTAGGPAKVLFRGPYSMPSPNGVAWTRDGRYVLAFGVGEPAHATRSFRLWAFPADGGDPRKTDLAMRALAAIGVAPDGRHLVFTGGRDDPEVWTIRNLLPAVPTATASTR
jgi:Tol biopolymer transport system component